ncbi:C4-dicarboxylate ABC transporter [Oribacterium sp. C9]|uniref:TRAP transporter substrate-binding protein n=1 Tax=Oribacterium sp. C9 TaxID=1943579 RepID=UPI00098F1CFA|nr:TRAP transporter substrate-binding protein [Oribacterium sp. C9]OON87666.1 C4-dicarboxylate ABC transporter [Oribacterium sp. C9]
MKSKNRLMFPALIAVFVIAFVMALVGCVEERGRQTYAWVVATASPEDTVTGIFANKFAEEVQRLSGGRLKVQVYHSSTLGGDTELIESVQCGDIPFVVQNTAPEVSYMPKLALFDLPCVFSNLDDLHRVLDDEKFMNRINDIYEDGDFHLLAMADQNFRVMTSDRNIKTMEDFSGIKIRTMENSNHMAFWSALGSNPTPMAFAELYVGLEQHTVDAQENPYEVICSNKFYEVQDYVVETNHLPHLLALVTNNRFYNDLPEEDRRIVDEAAEIAKQCAREQAVARADSRIEEIIAGGAEIVPLSEEMYSAMKDASKDVYEHIRTVVDDDELFSAYTGN